MEYRDLTEQEDLAEQEDPPPALYMSQYLLFLLHCTNILTRFYVIILLVLCVLCGC